jgi:hypothetical protein
MKRAIHFSMLLLLGGCASGQMSGAASEQATSTSEYFEASFDHVVDATYQSLSSLGMYVEDRYRSGLDQVITVQSTSPTASSNLLITIARPEAQGVRVSITSNSPSNPDPISTMHEAQTILSGIALRLGM